MVLVEVIALIAMEVRLVRMAEALANLLANSRQTYSLLVISLSSLKTTTVGNLAKLHTPPVWPGPSWEELRTCLGVVTEANQYVAFNNITDIGTF